MKNAYNVFENKYATEENAEQRKGAQVDRVSLLATGQRDCGQQGMETQGEDEHHRAKARAAMSEKESPFPVMYALTLKLPSLGTLRCQLSTLTFLYNVSFLILSNRNCTI